MNDLLDGRFGNAVISYRQGTSDEDVLAHSFDRDIFFKGIPEYSIKSSHTILDIGAHIGTFSILASQHLRRGQVFAFEPCSDTFRLLEKNKFQNKLENLSIFQIAVAGNAGKTKLYYDLEQGNWGHTISKALSNEGEEVVTDTLDNIFKQLRIKRCDLLKFNCEGAEFEIILNSSRETLGKVNYMLVLYHEDLISNYKAEHLLAYLNANGFKTKIKNQTDIPPRGWIIAYRSTYWNRILINFRLLWKVRIRQRVQRKLSLLFSQKAKN